MGSRSDTTVCRRSLGEGGPVVPQNEFAGTFGQDMVRGPEIGSRSQPMLAWAKRHGSAAWGGSATRKRPDKRQHLLTQSEDLPVAIIVQQAKTEHG